MKSINIPIFFIALFFPVIGITQSFILGDSAVLSISDGTTFFFGGNTTLNGKLSTTGSIVSYSDIDFVANTDVGNLKFTGTADQQLMGDTLSVGDFETDKDGILALNSDQVRVTGTLIPFRGVIRSGEGKMIHAGNVIADGDGYVEGVLYGRVLDQPTTFPMGLNIDGANAPNYITMTAESPGTTDIYRVFCRPALVDSLFPDEDMIGVAEQVEWRVSKFGTEASEVQVAIDYSEIDFTRFTNRNEIESDYVNPAIALFSEEDTLHHALFTTTNFVEGDNIDPVGLIESSDRIVINSVPKRFNMSLIPVSASPILYIPNAFAPGASVEENQIFRPFVSGAVVTGIRMTIYDALHQVVYSVEDTGASLDVSNYGWDGVIDTGLEAPDGVYFYSLQVDSPQSTDYEGDGEDIDFNKTLVGSVLLVR
jgi:hypothetical protein